MELCGLWVFGLSLKGPVQNLSFLCALCAPHSSTAPPADDEGCHAVCGADGFRGGGGCVCGCGTVPQCVAVELWLLMALVKTRYAGITIKPTSVSGL